MYKSVNLGYIAIAKTRFLWTPSFCFSTMIKRKVQPIAHYAPSLIMPRIKDH